MEWPKHRLTDDHDPHVQKWISENTHRGDVFYDIGAHTGIMTRTALSVTKNVYSIEPNPDAYDVLVSHDKHPKDALMVALWNQDKPLRLQFPVMWCSGQVEVHDNEEGYKIAGYRLDTIRPEVGWPKPKIVKSDTQGSEGRWLQGARDSLSDCDTMILEFWEDGLIAHGTKPSEMIDLLTDYGFEIVDKISSDILVKRIK